MFRNFLITATLLVQFLTTIPSSSSQSSKSAIRLGMVAPLTGDFASYGKEIIKGIEVARLQLEQEGIITEIHFENACLPRDVRTSINKLISANKIQALVASYCVIGMVASKDLLESNKIISFQTSGGTQEILGEEKYLFTTAGRTSDEGRKLAEYSYNILGLKKIAILYLQTQWGEEITSEFKNAFTKLGGVITGSASNVIGENNFRDELMHLRIGNPDGLLIAHLGGTLETAILQARNFGFKSKQLLGTSDAENVVGLRENNAGDLKFLSPEIFSDLKEVNEFNKSFLAKYGEIPASLANHAYDATMISARALQQCNGDPECSAKKIYALRDGYIGASGKFSIDSDGGTTRNFVPRTIR